MLFVYVLLVAAEPTFAHLVPVKPVATAPTHHLFDWVPFASVQPLAAHVEPNSNPPAPLGSKMVVVWAIEEYFGNKTKNKDVKNRFLKEKKRNKHVAT